jgi:hypothetical protein
MAMPQVKVRLMEDMHSHLGKQLHRLISDHVDTCTRADLDNREVASIVMSAMLFETTVAAYAMQIEEDSFLSICLESYQHMKDIIRQKQREAIQ